MSRRFVCAIAAGTGAIAAADAQAAVAYNAPGSTYNENFNKLPSDRNDNSNIQIPNPSDPNQVDYTDGWQDDVDAAVSPQDDVSVLGWHLRHPLDPGAAENGFNDHQRFRMGTGANTGSFWGFASSGALDDKALGSVGGTTVAGSGNPMYMGLQLTNNTGVTLTQFTVTYDGEQWRDGQSTSPETLSFAYSLDATDANWYSQPTDLAATTPTYTAVPALNFTAPVTAGVATGGTGVDGNGAGLVNDITATIEGISWAPGQELWLRWGDPQLAGNADDGLGIDEVNFSANVPEPTGLAALALGAVGLLRRRGR